MGGRTVGVVCMTAEVDVVEDAVTAGVCMEEEGDPIRVRRIMIMPGRLSPN